MHIFYNDTFDFRIAIKVDDFHQACDILRIYLKGQKYGAHELKVSDFKYESIDVVLE